ncbi:MAG: hypothetical protein WEC33_08715 [Dehalococcoidia bacterium]
MLFGFRWIRGFQVLLAIASGVVAIGAAASLKLWSDGGGWWQLAAGILLGLIFVWLFAAALRAPTSFVAVDLEQARTRIRMPPFIDTVIPHDDIERVAIVHRGWWWGLGVRPNFQEVALLTAWGEAAQFTLRRKVRVWLIPRLIPVRTTTLTVSIRNPRLLANKLGGTLEESPRPKRARRMAKRGSRTR